MKVNGEILYRQEKSYKKLFITMIYTLAQHGGIPEYKLNKKCGSRFPQTYNTSSTMASQVPYDITFSIHSGSSLAYSS